MTTHYLVKDQNGKYYIRRYVFGFAEEFLDNSATRNNADGSPYYWSGVYAVKWSQFATEAEAIARWEEVKNRPDSTIKFTRLRKLT
jgi:hypothetical protein